MTHLVGDPVSLMLRPEATEEQRQAVRERLGLNDPILVQFGRFIGGAVRGDFGESIWQRVPALPIVLDRLPATLYLASATLLLAVPLSILLGIISAIRPGSIVDRVVTVVSLGGVSTADFWLGLMLILLFAVRLGWLPTSGYGGVQLRDPARAGPGVPARWAASARWCAARCWTSSASRTSPPPAPKDSPSGSWSISTR